MILSDKTITDRIDEIIDFDRSVCEKDDVLKQINPNSLDLTISMEYMYPKANCDLWTYGLNSYNQEANDYMGKCWDKRNEGWCRENNTEFILLIPGRTILAVTQEYITMPDDLCGQIFTKSTLGRMFINHMMAGVVDAGFSGRLTLELRNEGEHNILIPIGSRVVQMVFQKLDQPAEHPYRARKSRYNEADTVECAKKERA